MPEQLLLNYLKKVKVIMQSSSLWYKDAIFYEVYVRAPARVDTKIGLPPGPGSELFVAPADLPLAAQG